MRQLRRRSIGSTSIGMVLVVGLDGQQQLVQKKRRRVVPPSSSSSSSTFRRRRRAQQQWKQTLFNFGTNVLTRFQ